MNKELLFVYGTLKRGHGNNQLLFGQKYMGDAITENPYIMASRGIPFVYEWNKAEQDGEIIRGKPIHGEIYQVDPHALADIDRLEGHPRWYRRKIIPIELHAEVNTRIHAWIYFMSDYITTPKCILKIWSHMKISDRF